MGAGGGVGTGVPCRWVGGGGMGWGPPQPGSPGMVHGGHFALSPFYSLSAWPGRKSRFVLRRSELGKLPDPSWALRIARLQLERHQGHRESPIHTPTPGFSLEGELPACLLLGKEMHWFPICPETEAQDADNDRGGSWGSRPGKPQVRWLKLKALQRTCG